MSAIRPLAGVLPALCAGACFAQPASLTIYNQNFAVVRETVRLDLKAGENEVRFTDITSRLEPDSLLLRDPAGKRALRVLEQNYRPDTLSQERMLTLYEGKTLDFLSQRPDRWEIVRAKVIRSYGPSTVRTYHNPAPPIVEVDGKIRFGLPGEPLFPTLAEGEQLKPTLHWLLWTDAAGPLDAELAYVTGGMHWRADYNIVAPETGDVVDLIGWVTLANLSGKTFRDARIKLLAGDLNKMRAEHGAPGGYPGGGGGEEALAPPRVIVRNFDEYHLYTLPRPTTLRDRETKQVEFVRAAGVAAQRLYVYDGAQIDRSQYRRSDADSGLQSSDKVWVMREFANTAANGLGIPLPQGRLRFYRRDVDGALEFVGENAIDHTPKNETLRVYTGNAFDLVGARRRTEHRRNGDANYLDESFEITLRNRKNEPVEVRVVERFYREHNWRIIAKSHAFLKTDSNTIEFRIPVPPNEEKTVTYTVRYRW